MAPTIPFWLGEAPGRSDELSASVSRLRDRRSPSACAAIRPGASALRWLIDELAHQLRRRPSSSSTICAPAMPRSAACRRRTRSCSNASSTRRAACSSSSIRPTAAGSTAPGAWRCASASAASSISSSRPPRPRTTSSSRSPRRTASRSTTSRATCIRPRCATVLTQALLDSPMFTTRWRWVAGVSLALPRFRGGRKVPPQLARMGAEDLIGAVFPDQIACAENLPGRARDPRPSAGPPGDRRLPERGDGHRRPRAAAQGNRVGRDPRGRARPHAALAARPRSAVGAALRLSRRRAARGAPHPGGDGAALAGAGAGRRSRPSRCRGDRAGARRGLARRGERRRAARRAGLARLPDRGRSADGAPAGATGSTSLRRRSARRSIEVAGSTALDRGRAPAALPRACGRSS